MPDPRTRRGATLTLVGVTVGALLLAGSHGQEQADAPSSASTEPPRTTAPAPDPTPRPRRRETTEPEPAQGDEASPSPRAGEPARAAREGPSRREDRVDRWLDALDRSERVRQLLVLRVYGGGIDEADPRNQRRYGVATPREVIETFRPGGVLLFRADGGTDTGNLRNPEQVRTFTDDLRAVAAEHGPPPLIAIDQEGGPVDRIGHFGTSYPAAREIGADEEAAAEHARTTVTELAALGVDLNFAPVADVDTEPRNPVIGPRSPGDDPDEVARHVLAQLEVYEGSGVAATVKHFPGHGDTTADSHDTLPVVDADLATLRRREFVPFERAVDAGVPAVMTAHLALPALVDGDEPVSLSREVVTGLLREELGFEGVVASDSLEMTAVREGRPDRRVAVGALRAGHDLLVLPPAPQASRRELEEAVATGRVSERQLNEAVRRVLRLKAGLAEETGERPDPAIVGGRG